MTDGRSSRIRFPFYYGWVIVGVVALSGFTQSAGTFPVLGVLLNPITDEFGWSHTVFTGATSIGTIIGGVVALVVGPMVDRAGARWILVVAFTALGASFVMMAGVTQLWQFYVLQIVSRVSNMGMIALATQVIIPKWFVERRGRAVALGSLGIMAGNAVTPLYVQYVLGIWGWRWASASAGIVIWVVSLLPVAMFLRRTPEDMGLLPDGVTQEEMERRIAEGVDGGGAGSVGPEISLLLRQVVRLPSFYLLVAAFSLAFGVFPGLLLHLIPYLTEQGIDPSLGVWVVAVWSASGAIGALVAGLLTERYGARLSLAASFVLMATGFWFLLAVDSIQLSLVWGAYMGVLGGGMMTFYQIIFADYYGRESLGAVRGVVWPVQMLTNAAGPLSAAVVHDLTGNYNLIFTIFGVLITVASLCIFLARPPVKEALTSIGRTAVGGDGT